MTNAITPQRSADLDTEIRGPAPVRETGRPVKAVRIPPSATVRAAQHGRLRVVPLRVAGDVPVAGKAP